MSIGCGRKNSFPFASPIHIDDRDADRVEHARPWIGVIHIDHGLARHIAIDGENVRDRAWPAEEGIHSEGGVARRHEFEVAPADGVGDLETISRLAVLHGDQALILEALEIDEGAVLFDAWIGGGEHGAARLVAEEV